MYPRRTSIPWQLSWRRRVVPRHANLSPKGLSKIVGASLGRLTSSCKSPSASSPSSFRVMSWCPRFWRSLGCSCAPYSWASLSWHHVSKNHVRTPVPDRENGNLLPISFCAQERAVERNLRCLFSRVRAASPLLLRMAEPNLCGRRTPSGRSRQSACGVSPRDLCQSAARHEGRRTWGTRARTRGAGGWPSQS